MAAAETPPAPAPLEGMEEVTLEEDATDGTEEGGGLAGSKRLRRAGLFSPGGGESLRPRFLFASSDIVRVGTGNELCRSRSWKEKSKLKAKESKAKANRTKRQSEKKGVLLVRGAEQRTSSREKKVDGLSRSC